MAHILYIEKDPEYGRDIRCMLKRRGNHVVAHVCSLRDAKEALSTEQAFDLVVVGDLSESPEESCKNVEQFVGEQVEGTGKKFGWFVSEESLPPTERRGLFTIQKPYKRSLRFTINEIFGDSSGGGAVSIPITHLG